MTIKTIQNLVSEVMSEIKTIDADEAYQMFQNKNCNLIDIRESNELENTGSVEGASHIPRGMLEVYLDPNSPIFQNGQIDQNKEFVLFCAGGVRSALAVHFTNINSIYGLSPLIDYEKLWKENRI